MKHLTFPLAVFSLFMALCLTACIQEQSRPTRPAPQLSTLLKSIPRDTFITVFDTLPFGDRRPGIAVDTLSLELTHATNDFLLCFRNGSYIDLEKCLPGMHKGNRHRLNIPATANDTLTVVNTRTMSYMQFIADTRFGNININIDWKGDTAHVVYREIFCGTGAEVIDYSL